MGIDKSKLDKEKKKELELNDTLLWKRYDIKRDKNKIAKYYHTIWINEMLNMIPFIPHTILDYCCATPIFFPLINQKFNANYVGVDISSKIVNLGEKRFGNYQNYKIYQQDGEDLKFKNNSFDVVISRGAIHHLTNPSKGLNEINRTLKKQGVLIISEPIGNKIIKIIRRLFYAINPYFLSSHKSFTYPELKKILQENGFKIKKIKRFGLISYPFGFPDILPFISHTPLLILKIFLLIDNILFKIPVIKNFYWTLLICAEKTEIR